MDNLDDVLDRMAFVGLKPRELIAKIATDVTARKPFPSRIDIENHVANLVARYGGHLGEMTRKNLVSRVARKLKITTNIRWQKTLLWLNSVRSPDAPSA